MGDWSVWGNQLWFKDFNAKSTVSVGGSSNIVSNGKRIFKTEGKQIKNDFKEYLKFFLDSILHENPTLIKSFC
jgi:hypothetical protein